MDQGLSAYTEKAIQLRLHHSTNESFSAINELRQVRLLNGQDVPVQIVHGTLEALRLLYKFDECCFDALVRACRSAEGEIFGGLDNIPFLLRSLGFIDGRKQPYPLVKEIVLLCVVGDDPLNLPELHYPGGKVALSNDDLR